MRESENLLIIITSIVSIVCWIMVLIRIFRENIGLGILGIICGLFAFIYGWVKVREYDIKGVMTWWTVAIVVGMLVQMIFGAAIVSALMQGSGA